MLPMASTAAWLLAAIDSTSFLTSSVALAVLQGLDFIRDDREALTCFARPGRLDCCVEGEKVGLSAIVEITLAMLSILPLDSSSSATVELFCSLHQLRFLQLRILADVLGNLRDR